MQLFLRQAYYQVCRLIFSFYCKLHVKGTENLPPPPYILCSNHCSHFDTPILMLATRLSFHLFGMVVAKDYFFGPKKRKRWLSQIMNFLPVERVPGREAIAKHLDLCRQFLQRQKGVLILYPEGTRSTTGTLQQLKKGAAQYAHHLQVPLVPVHIQGTFQALRKGTLFPRPHAIHVNIGQPIYVREPGLPMLRRITAELEAQILQLKATHDSL